MIASLPMYMRPENKDAHNRYWQLISANLAHSGIAAPAHLSEGEDTVHWLRRDLVLSQTCGMPYRLRLHGHVQLVGTPDFGSENCPAGYYNSIFIVNTQQTRTKLGDFRTASIAVNAMISQSGYAAPQTAAKKAGFQFENITVSGGHVTSAKWVASGQADIAAIDEVTWRNIQKYDDFSSDLKVLTKTEPTPALPYICAFGMDKDMIAQAVTNAIAQLTPADRNSLNIRGLIQIPSEAYLAIENP